MINDFRQQLEASERDSKQLSLVVNNYIDSLAASALASGKVAGSLKAAVKTESDFGTAGKYEFTNKDAEGAIATMTTFAEAFDAHHKVELAQPDNFEFILRAGARFAVNQVAAFKEFISAREAQNKEVMRVTAQLDGHLENQRNGKAVKASGLLGMMGALKGKSAEDVIAETQAELDAKTQVRKASTFKKNASTSAQQSSGRTIARVCSGVSQQHLRPRSLSGGVPPLQPHHAFS